MWWLVAGCICVPSVGSNVVRVAEAGCAGLESGVTCSSTISPFSAPTSLHCPALAHPSTPTLVPVSPQPCPAASSRTAWSRVTCHELVTCATCPLLHGAACRLGWVAPGGGLLQCAVSGATAAAGCCWPRVGRARTEVHTAAAADTLHPVSATPPRPPWPRPPAPLSWPCSQHSPSHHLQPPAPGHLHLALLQPPVLRTSNNYNGPLPAVWAAWRLGLPAGLEAKLCVEALEMVKEGQKPTGLSMSTIFT